MLRRFATYTALCTVLSVLITACSSHSSSVVPVAPRGRSLKPADASATYASVVLGDHPTAYYRLDDTGATALDSSGNNYNGAIGTSVSTGIAGLISGADTAMGFPGGTTSAGVVKVPQQKAMEATTSVTLEAWMRFSTIPKSYTTAVAYGSDRAYAPYSLFFRANATLVAQFYTVAGVLEVADPTPLSINTTYHAVSTYDGTTGRLYLNGVLVASGSKTSTLSGYIAGFGFCIGDDAALEDPEFVGTLDDVAVYAGQVLSATQIANHYAAGTGAGATTPTPSPTPTAPPSPTPTPIVGSGYASVILGDGPQAYYHLDDTGTTALDASGHHFNGTIGSGVTTGSTSLLPSYSDTAMTFPGTQSAVGIVTVPQTTALQPASSLTLEAWMQFASIPTTYTFVTGYGTDSNYAPWGLYFRPNGQITAQFYLSSGLLEVPSSVPLRANTVYHVAMTYDGTTGRIYVNGVQTGSGTSTGTFRDYFAGFAIGDDAGKSDPAFKGTIDEVAVYTKTLTPTQLLTHYTAGTSGIQTTPTPVPTATPVSVDWDSFGYDLQRTGYNPNETIVGVGNVASLQPVWTASINSSPVHELVYAANVNVNGTPTNIVYGGSEYGSAMYAFNAATGATIWQDPVPSANYQCGTSVSQFSVGETPAIDRTKNVIYFADGHNQVHAVDLATGREASGWPIQVADYTPDHNFMHGGMTYVASTGTLYVVTGSTCDIDPWYGRVVAINTNAPAIAATWFTMSGNASQGTAGGGIWGPGGVSVDPANGTVFAATGNADEAQNPSQASGYAEEVVELSSSLTLLANNYPSNIPVIPQDQDFDFGATPLIFTPPGCPTLVAAENKSGMLELYDEATISNGPVQYIPVAIPTDAGSFVGIPAYDPQTNLVYVGLPSSEGPYVPGVSAFSISSNCTLNTTPAWVANFGPDGTLTQSQEPRSPISIANGVLYVGNYTGDTEFAFNAASGAQLWSAALSSWGNVGTVIANGMVYVTAGDGTITAYAPATTAANLIPKVPLSRRYHGVHHHRTTPHNPWSPWGP